MQFEILTLTGGFSTLLDWPQIKELLRDFNQEHFRQANKTPFGSNRPGTKFLDPDGPECQNDSILNGMFHQEADDIT